MKAFLFFTFISFLLEAQSTNYKLDHEKVFFTYYNKEYLRNIQISLFQFNESTKAYNISGELLQDLPIDFKVGIQALRFQRGTYRSFPSRVAPVWCDMVARNDFGIRNMFSTGNLTECPIRKGKYMVTNFMVDDDKIPSQFLIPGRYKVKGMFFNKTVTFSRFEWCIGIVPV